MQPARAFPKAPARSVRACIFDGGDVIPIRMSRRTYRQLAADSGKELLSGASARVAWLMVLACFAALRLPRNVWSILLTVNRVDHTGSFGCRRNTGRWDVVNRLDRRLCATIRGRVRGGVRHHGRTFGESRLRRHTAKSHRRTARDDRSGYRCTRHHREPRRSQARKRRDPSVGRTNRPRRSRWA